MFLDDDLAFHIRPEFLAPWIARKGTGKATCLRTDGESLGLVDIPTENRDISLSWNGCLWQDRALTECVVSSLLAYLSSFESIETDRLHIGILSSLLGRSVRLLPNGYYKNRAVFETSLTGRQNTCFIDTQINDKVENNSMFGSEIAENINKPLMIQNTASNDMRVKQIYSLKALKFILMEKMAFSQSKRNHYRSKIHKLITGKY